MGKFLAKMERKYGKYAIRNLPLYTTIIYAAGFLMAEIWPGVFGILSLNPYAIVHGQVWRLVTWILLPESGLGIFFTLLSMYFYYSVGRTLERAWGSFLYNVYYFSGIILTILGAFLLFGYLELFGQDFLQLYESVYALIFGGSVPAIYGGSGAYAVVANFFGIYYIHMSIFLAFAITYPDAQVYLFFILPIKVKVLGVIYVIVMLYPVVTGFMSGVELGIVQLIVIGMSLLNTLIFFLVTRKRKIKSPKDIKRQHDYKVKVRAASNVTRHKCAICGQTEKDNANLSFRYCSKCEGNYEYCSEHLFTHEHVKRH